ncbi:PREDICTED: uncharacterized protein LOC109339643 [Lupinus angustifolius]|uniref:uncharacterized protein LOC109339643 n=1 Tax=Lupinus angustifolius TaxID=3871 RepID=UPI00092EF325|nr:PREDICTED: uncharacterized protein LOC109339643 [Lupinus angustifolius]
MANPDYADFNTNPYNPFFLHSNENLALVMVTPLLNGKNYHSWERDIKMGLESKKKIIFLDGSLPQPAPDDIVYEPQKRCNNLVLSWIQHSAEESIIKSTLWIDSAAEAWKYLKDRFSQGDTFRIVELQEEFYHFSQGNFLSLKHLVNEYASASGQHINANKCKFYSTNASPRKLANLKTYLGFSDGSLPFSYLGVPITIGKPKKTHLQPIADKILAKLAKWKGTSLSIMSRVELMKSVIQSMLMYSFHIYKWPTQLLKNVDRKIRNFIWSGDTEVKKLEWARFYKNRFGCNRSTPTRYFKSSIWPGIKDHWHLVFNNSIWLVGERLNINFWKDNWLGDPLVELLDIPPHLHSSLHAKVDDFIHNSNWIIPDTLAIRHPMISKKIASTIVSEGMDKFVWHNTNDGTLSLKATFACVCNHIPQLSGLKHIWSAHIAPSKSFILWRLLKNRMPMDNNLQKRGCAMGSICNLCNTNAESTDHMFLQCPFAMYIWSWLSSIFSISLDLSSINFAMSISKTSLIPLLNHVLLACITHTITTIWYGRNQLRFEDRKISMPHTIAKIKRETSLVGSCSNAIAFSSLQEFIILKFFHVPLNYSKALTFTEVIWQKPTLGVVKVNIDGSAHGSPGHARGGGIFRDHHGAFIASFATYLAINNALFAELHTTILSVEIAYQKGRKNLWLECDSTLVVSIFEGTLNPPWQLQNILQKCKLLLGNMNFNVSHIFREGNTCADKLANHGILTRSNTWWNTMSSFISAKFIKNRAELPSYRFRNL